MRPANAQPLTAPPVSDSAALIVLPIRLVVGWTFFSAFWRRVALADALDPNAHGYIGEKFNHFLPHALAIKPMIEYLVTRPGELHVAMTVFTIVEAVVGLCLMLGLFTRLMGVAVSALAFGILLGSGWLGSTCVDEWQIGILGLASGITLFFSGGGRCSLDQLLVGRYRAIAQKAWLRWLASGEMAPKKVAAVSASAAVLCVALFTNQYFHGGLYGPLHNNSVKPALKVSGAHINGNELRFGLTRTAGPDTYGSFLIDVAVVDAKTQTALARIPGHQLGSLSERDITNERVAQVHPGENCLVVPLGAKAQVTVKLPQANIDPNGRYELALTDISDTTWTTDVKVEH
jgi:uncharacterized membrane protein YphA (DoxX/SURF4 family)